MITLQELSARLAALETAHHHSLTGCPGDVGPDGGPPDLEGLVGMPGPRGPNADGSPGETEEDHLQRWREAEAHNARYFAKHPDQRA